MSATEAPRVRVLSCECGPELGLVEGEGSSRAIVHPGMGTDLRALNVITLASGSRTVTQLHPHDAVYYVASGAASVAEPGVGTVPLIEGSVIHIDAGTAYAFEAATDCQILGGSAPADSRQYEGVL